MGFWNTDPELEVEFVACRVGAVGGGGGSEVGLEICFNLNAAEEAGGL